jgi:hypothetical protein
MTAPRDRLPASATRLLACVAVGSCVALVAACEARAATAAAPVRATAAAPACAPPTLEQSAAVGGGVTVSPAPGSVDASYRTQISFLGPSAASIANVLVVGSRSGAHPGQLAAYSQGDGASFTPSAPFAEGEFVTVRAVVQSEGGTPIEWHFTTAERDTASRSLETPPRPAPAPRATQFQHFVSIPDLEAPAVTVTTNSGRQSPGDLFLAPYAGPGEYGPMILDAGGGLIWFRSLPSGARAADLRVQEYEGEPVLTWWQDPLIAGGHRGAGVVIADNSYRDIAFVRAGNGYEPDLHAFQITPQGTALFTVYDAIRCNLSAYGGPADGAIADTLLQEIDLRTGLVRFEWHSLDHVAPWESYMPARPGGTQQQPWDYFHINGVHADPDGELLVDARNTWAAYEVNARTGQIVWRLGGKRSSFALAPGANTAWQHDAELGASGTVTFFDNGGSPRIHAQSRGVVLALDEQHMTAALVSSFVHPTPLLAASQGNFQPLPDGDWFVGWGQEPYFSEFAPNGRVLFDAHLPPEYQSYTVLKYSWSGQPPQRPRIALRPARGGGERVYVSWNGGTGVTAWEVLAGRSARGLFPIARAPRRGFETLITLAAAHRYLAVRALGGNGQVLATSAVARS